MRTTNLFLSTFLVLVATASLAHAEGPQTPAPAPPPDGGQQGQQGQQGYYEQPGYGNGQNPNGQQGVMGQPGDQQGQQGQQGNGQPVMGGPAPDANQQAQQGRGIEYGAYAYVPVFIASANTRLGAGIGIQGRIGWEFGSGFTAELQGGLSWNSIDTYGLTNLWIGGGIRYSFLNDSPFVPFIGAGINLNFWGLTTVGNNDAIAFGFSALAGLAYELSADVAIEGGLQFFGTSDATTAGGSARIFQGDFAFGLAPFAGLTLYY